MPGILSHSKALSGPRGANEDCEESQDGLQCSLVLKSQLVTEVKCKVSWIESDNLTEVFCGLQFKRTLKEQLKTDPFLSHVEN